MVILTDTMPAKSAKLLLLSNSRICGAVASWVGRLCLDGSQTFKVGKKLKWKHFCTPPLISDTALCKTAYITL